MHLATPIFQPSQKDRFALKVSVSAPPEDGRANDAICGILASALGIRARRVRVVSGPASRDKTLRIDGLTAAEAGRRLGVPQQ